jgi:hypothetical protein
MTDLINLILKSYTREELRDIAKNNNIKRGRDKVDTAKNIIDSGKFALKFTWSKRGSINEAVFNNFGK